MIRTTMKEIAIIDMLRHAIQDIEVALLKNNEPSCAIQVLIHQHISVFQGLKTIENHVFIGIIDECIAFFQEYLNCCDAPKCTPEAQSNRTDLITKLMLMTQPCFTQSRQIHRIGYFNLDNQQSLVLKQRLSLSQLSAREKHWGIHYVMDIPEQHLLLRSKLAQEQQISACSQLIKGIRQGNKILKKTKGILFDQKIDQDVSGLQFEAMILELFQLTQGSKAKFSTLEQDILESTDLIIERKNPFHKYHVQLSLSPLASIYEKKLKNNRRMRCDPAQKRILTPYTLALTLQEGQGQHRSQALSEFYQAMMRHTKGTQGLAYAIKSDIDQALKQGNRHPLGASMLLMPALKELIVETVFQSF
jgi:hypothetical protein